MPSEQDIHAGLAEILQEETGQPPAELSSETTLAEGLALSSLSVLTVLVQIEHRFGVRIPDAGFSSLRTVGDVVATLQRLEQEQVEREAAPRA